MDIIEAPTSQGHLIVPGCGGTLLRWCCGMPRAQRPSSQQMPSAAEVSPVPVGSQAQLPSETPLRPGHKVPSVPSSQLYFGVCSQRWQQPSGMGAREPQEGSGSSPWEGGKAARPSTQFSHLYWVPCICRILEVPGAQRASPAPFRRESEGGCAGLWGQQPRGCTGPRRLESRGKEVSEEAWGAGAWPGGDQR